MKNTHIRGYYALLYSQIMRIAGVMRITTFAQIFCITCAFAENVSSQTTPIDIRARDISIAELIKQIEKQTDYLFVYNPQKVDLSQKTSMEATNIPVAKVLTNIFEDTDVTYVIEGSNILLMKKSDSNQPAIKQSSDIKITGIVTDESGEAVIGANIQVKGTAHGTITDYDGKFVLSVPKDAILIVSYLGMASQELPAQPSMKIILKSDSQLLTEVVVTGMRQMDKRLFTGASDKLSASSVKIDGIAEISRGLEGRSAGVTVQNVSGTFGTSPKIRVRGSTSIYGSSKPLWVVDGVIIEDVMEISSDQLSSGNAETLISSAIAGLNADDIESFDILKDGSATSIYGARAMNGVIVVTTKKGKAGTHKISYTGEYSYRLVPGYRNFNIMNSQEQMGVYRELEANGYLNMAELYRASNSGVYGRMYHLINTFDKKTGTYGLANTVSARNGYLREAEYRNTDWFNILFNKNISMNHGISMSSGTEKASYYVSLSFMDDPGWTKRSAVKRYTSNVNGLYHISKSVTLNLIGNGSYRKQKAPGTLSQDIDAASGKVKRDFDINPYSYALNTSRTLDPNTMYVRNYAPFNILHELENNYIDLDIVDLRFQGELKWKITNKLEATSLLAYKYSSTTQGFLIKENSNQAWAYRAMDDATMRDANPWLYTDPDNPNSLPISVLPVGGFYKETKYSMNGYDFRGTVSYNDVFSEKHIVNLFGGTEVNAVDRTRTNFEGVGLQYEMGMLPAFDYRYFKQLSEENTEYYNLSLTKGRLVSFFGSGTYSYMGKYTVNGTVRYEGSNRLGKSRSARWLPTWNISAAWNAHEEDFFTNLKSVISHLSLKTSYSLTADHGPGGVSNSRVEIGSYNPWRAFTGIKESGLRILNLENKELTYEKKYEINVGVEVGVLNNRVNLVVDWYKRNNFDLIGRINTPGVGGQISKFANMAEMKSHGIEFSLTTKNIDTKDFKWSSSFIFSNAKNEVTKLESNTTRVIDMITGTGFTMEGYPVRSLFSLDYRGLNSEGLPTFINEEGVVTVNNINFQESIIKDHLVYAGPIEPPTNGSFGNLFFYRNFRLNVFLTYSFGNFIRLDPIFSDNYSDLDAMPREFKNRWTQPKDELKTDVPVIPDYYLKKKYNNHLDFAYNAYNLSTIRVAKGDFIRMKEISLSYDFPKSFISPIKINDLSLKLQATNLFLIYADKKLNGQDPEFFNTGGVATPLPQQFTMTVRVGF